MRPMNPKPKTVAQHQAEARRVLRALLDRHDAVGFLNIVADVLRVGIAPQDMDLALFAERRVRDLARDPRFHLET